MEIIFVLFIISFLSCNNDDEIVDINQLTGKWDVAYDDPNIVVEGYTTYTFNTDNSCSIYSYDALSNRDTTIYWTYQIGSEKDLITFFMKNKFYTAQYYIRKLTSREMKWENTTPNGGDTFKKFTKVK